MSNTRFIWLLRIRATLLLLFLSQLIFSLYFKPIISNIMDSIFWLSFLNLLDFVFYSRNETHQISMRSLPLDINSLTFFLYLLTLVFIHADIFLLFQILQIFEGQFTFWFRVHIFLFVVHPDHHLFLSICINLINILILRNSSIHFDHLLRLTIDI